MCFTEVVLPKILECTLPQLDNQSFEELAVDIYDEVDRRETERGNYLPSYLPSYLLYLIT